MVENAFDFVVEKKSTLEKEFAAAHAATLDALEERKGYFYMKYKAKSDEKAAVDRAAAVELSIHFKTTSRGGGIWLWLMLPITCETMRLIGCIVKISLSSEKM